MHVFPPQPLLFGKVQGARVRVQVCTCPSHGALLAPYDDASLCQSGRASAILNARGVMPASSPWNVTFSRRSLVYALASGLKSLILPRLSGSWRRPRKVYASPRRVADGDDQTRIVKSSSSSSKDHKKPVVEEPHQRIVKPPVVARTGEPSPSTCADKNCCRGIRVLKHMSQHTQVHSPHKPTVSDRTSRPAKLQQVRARMMRYVVHMKKTICTRTAA